jgi:putative FmdB family regulatory protein
MPIYAYRCDSCGHAKDVLQKISDPLLTVCPACGAESFKKQVTAAGFQLKGSGWYVTDFRGGATAPSAEAGAGGAKPAAVTGSEHSAGQDKSGKAEAAVSSTAASTTATPSAPASGGTSGAPSTSSST